MERKQSNGFTLTNFYESSIFYENLWNVKWYLSKAGVGTNVKQTNKNNPPQMSITCETHKAKYCPSRNT